METEVLKKLRSTPTITDWKSDVHYKTAKHKHRGSSSIFRRFIQIFIARLFGPDEIEDFRKFYFMKSAILT